MAREIRLRKAELDIVFKDDDDNEVIAFKYDKSDENGEKVFGAQERLMKAVADAHNDDGYSISKMLEDIKVAFDTLLGEVAFDKLYKLSPSWEIMIVYFIEVCKAIADDTNQNFDELNEAIAKYADNLDIK